MYVCMYVLSVCMLCMYVQETYRRIWKETTAYVTL